MNGESEREKKLGRKLPLSFMLFSQFLSFFLFLPLFIDQLKNIWSPTNPFLSRNYENGTWIRNDSAIDWRLLVGKTIKVALVNVNDHKKRNKNDQFVGLTLFVEYMKRVLGKKYLEKKNTRLHPNVLLCW